MSINSGAIEVLTGRRLLPQKGTKYTEEKACWLVSCMPVGKALSMRWFNFVSFVPVCGYTHLVGVCKYLCLLLAMFAVVGCADEPAAEPAQATSDDTEPRFVTVAPALSQMIVDLGLGDAIVGVAEYETAAPVGLPIVGNYSDVNTEMLLATNPTHVLMMVGPGGPPGRLNDLAGRGLFALHTYPFPLSIRDIGLVLYDELPTGSGGASLGEALGVSEKARALKMRMLRQLAAIG